MPSKASSRVDHLFDYLESRDMLAQVLSIMMTKGGAPSIPVQLLGRLSSRFFDTNFTWSDHEELPLRVMNEEWADYYTRRSVGELDVFVKDGDMTITHPIINEL
jgi:hypothetical protein